MSTLHAVEQAVEAFRLGRPVVVSDHEDREDEGDVIIAAQHVTKQHIAFMMSECRGLICVAMTGSALERLGVPPMTTHNSERHRTAFAVSVDARQGITTGISAADRARTIRLLADPQTAASALVQPGHIFPLRAAEGGLSERSGHTEAGVELARLAGLEPAAVICEVADREGEMVRGADLAAFADRHGLPLISIEALTAWPARRQATGVPGLARIAATECNRR